MVMKIGFALVTLTQLCRRCVVNYPWQCSPLSLSLLLEALHLLLNHSQMVPTMMMVVRMAIGHPQERLGCLPFGCCHIVIIIFQACQWVAADAGQVPRGQHQDPTPDGRLLGRPQVRHHVCHSGLPASLWPLPLIEWQMQSFCVKLCKRCHIENCWLEETARFKNALQE